MRDNARIVTQELICLISFARVCCSVLFNISNALHPISAKKSGTQELKTGSSSEQEEWVLVKNFVGTLSKVPCLPK